MKKIFFSVALIISLVLVGCSETEVEGQGGKVESDDNASADENEDASEETDASEEESEINEVIVDNESYEITLLEIIKKQDDIFGDTIEAVYEVENKLDTGITVQARNVSADGYMVDEALITMSQDIVGGKKAKAVLEIYDLEGYDFPELENEFEMTLHVLDMDSYEGIDDHEVKVSF